MCWSLNPANLSFERSLDFFVTTQPVSATESDYMSATGIIMPMPTVPSNFKLCVDVEINEDVVIENQERFMLILMSMDPVVNFDFNSHISQVCNNHMLYLRSLHGSMFPQEYLEGEHLNSIIIMLSDDS